MQNTINVKDGKVSLIIDNESRIAGIAGKIIIRKDYIENNILKQNIAFSKWDDMQFNGYVPSINSSNAVTQIDFPINIDDKIYFALNRLIGTDDSFIIDDDDTYENMINYIEIKKINNQIIVSFHDKRTYEERSSEGPLSKFRVFIKNIGQDPRSKIDDSSIKIRLFHFFNEAKEILVSENHQYSLDEYYEMLTYLDKCKEKNSFITNNSSMNFMIDRTPIDEFDEFDEFNDDDYEETFERYSRDLADEYINEMLDENFEALGKLDSLILTKIIWYNRKKEINEQILDGSLMTRRNRTLIDAITIHHAYKAGMAYSIPNPKFIAMMICYSNEPNHYFLQYYDYKKLTEEEWYQFIYDVFVELNNIYELSDSTEQIKLLKRIKENLLNINAPKNFREIELENNKLKSKLFN